MLVADASVLIEFLRGGRSAGTVLRRHQARGPVIVPAVAAWELWRGATSRQRREGIQALLEALQVEGFSPALARLAGDLDLQQRRSGRQRPALDLLIAAHALYHDAPLATLDRDYDGIEGLDVLRVREEA